MKIILFDNYNNGTEEAVDATKERRVLKSLNILSAGVGYDHWQKNNRGLNVDGVLGEKKLNPQNKDEK